jgi:hypothetical protein
VHVTRRDASRAAMHQTVSAAILCEQISSQRGNADGMRVSIASLADAIFEPRAPRSPLSRNFRCVEKSTRHDRRREKIFTREAFCGVLTGSAEAQIARIGTE